LAEGHRKELSFEELVELHNEEADSLQQMITFGNKDEEKEKSHSIPAEDLKKVFSCWNTVQTYERLSPGYWRCGNGS